MKLVAGLFKRRLRGFRIVNLTALACLSALVLGVYALKAHAGGESAKITEVDSQIVDEQRRIRLLNADLARLEQPERLERLSTQYLGLTPVAAKHETTPTSLMEIARQGAPTKSTTAAPSDGKPASQTVQARSQTQSSVAAVVPPRASVPQ